MFMLVVVFSILLTIVLLAIYWIVNLLFDGENGETVSGHSATAQVETTTKKELHSPQEERIEQEKPEGIPPERARSTNNQGVNLPYDTYYSYDRNFMAGNEEVPQDVTDSIASAVVSDYGAFADANYNEQGELDRWLVSNYAYGNPQLAAVYTMANKAGWIVDMQHFQIRHTTTGGEDVWKVSYELINEEGITMYLVQGYYDSVVDSIKPIEMTFTQEGMAAAPSMH